MKNNYTHLVFLRDRSGSMSIVKNDVIGGFNEFIAEQKKEPGELTVTSVQFDTMEPYQVLNDFSPLHQVELLNENNYVPRGGTPLNDALGKLIVEASARGMGTSVNYMASSIGTKAAFRGSSKLAKMMRTQSNSSFASQDSYSDQLQKDYEESLKEIEKEEEDKKDSK